MTLHRSLPLGLVAGVIFLSIAPVAYAQDLPDADSVVGTAGGTVTTAGDTASSPTDAGTTVTGTVDSATDAAGTASGAVNDATGGATAPVTDAAGSASGTVDDTTGTVRDTVENATGGGGENGGGSVTDKVKDTVGSTTGSGSSSSPPKVIDNLLGGNGSSGSVGVMNLGHLTPDLIDDLVKEAAGLGMSPVAAEGWIEGKKVVGGAAYEDANLVLSSLSALVSDLAESAAPGTSGGSDAVSFSTSGSGSSFLDAAGRAAIGAAKALAFPLALALAVGAFLAVQGRIGRKDPKLALAPVDTAEETLIFE